RRGVRRGPRQARALGGGHGLPADGHPRRDRDDPGGRVADWTLGRGLRRLRAAGDRAEAFWTAPRPGAGGGGGARVRGNGLAASLGRAVARAPIRLCAVLLPLIRGLPALVDVLDAGNVLDGAPGGSRRAAHRVHQGLADLIVRGAGLL